MRYSKSIADKLVQDDIIQETDKIVVEFGLRQLFAVLRSLSITFLISFFLNKVLECVIFLLFFWPLRVYAGGYHAKTSQRCLIISVVSIFVILELNDRLILSQHIIFIITLLFALIIYKVIPQENTKKKLDIIEYKVYRKRGKCILVIELAISIVMHIIDYSIVYGIYASMQQYLGNIIVVILNKAKLLFFSEFVKKERSYQKECAELDIQYAVFDQIGSLFSSIIRVFIYTYGGMKIIKSQMTMGELIAFIEYTTLFINPCIRILKSNASIQKLKVSINRIYDFLEMKNSIAQNNYGIKIRNRINEIVFDNVSFSYDKKMVIENLSFKLERGKTYAFVGETGCGKSTIVNLLFRLWDTKSGNIMIDGENIKEYNLFSLRKQLSIATQNVYIKDDSIENNILMGRKKEDCAYDEICKLVGMESILSKFPKEKDVSVGENGNKLSGGQKQRIAMARALVHADNVLILDEATSALDNITQNEIMKNIKPLYQDKIVIIITHRLDTISDVDKIFVMSEGRICEEGQHNELMKKGEKYYALVQNL